MSSREPGVGFVELGVVVALILVTFLFGMHVAAALGLLSLTLMLFFSDRPMWDLLGRGQPPRPRRRRDRRESRRRATKSMRPSSRTCCRRIRAQAV
jgi:hypothetical protein